MKLNQKEVYHILSDGHSIITEECAKGVCDFLKIELPRELVKTYKSDWTPENFKGLMMKEGQENTKGVYTLELSEYVAEKLDVVKEAGSFIGRGFQAKGYAKAIARKMNWK